MPISAENRALYPPRAEWLAIRARILSRAQHACEWCARRDREWQVVGPGSQWVDSDVAHLDLESNGVELDEGWRLVKTILTVAHLDQDPTNNDDDNLRALCQRCHLTHDAGQHARNAARTRDRKRGQTRMFEEAR